MSGKIIRSNRSTPRGNGEVMPWHDNYVEPSEPVIEASSDFVRIVSELDVIKQNKKLIEERETKLKLELGALLEKEGVKNDKGSFVKRVGNKVAVKEARKSVKLNPEKAEAFFKELGIWDEVVEIKEVINENYVEQALLNEKFTMEELEEVTDIKTTYAIVLRDYKPEEDGQ